MADGPQEQGKPQARRTPARRSVRWPHGPQITPRDIEIVQWITRHGVVTAELVGRRFFWRADAKTYGKWAAYRRLAAIEQAGFIIRDKPFAHAPGVIRVTRAGAGLADVGLAPAPLVLSQLRHSLAVVLLTERLLAEHPDATLETERELRAERYRLRRGGHDTSSGRTPDAILHLPGPTDVAIELDLTRKDQRALHRMVNQYDQEDVDRIWWYVMPSRVQRTRDFVASVNADDRVEVRPWHGPE